VSSKDKKETTITVDGQILQQVPSFVYRGSTFQETRECEMDIRKDLACEEVQCNRYQISGSLGILLFIIKIVHVVQNNEKKKIHETIKNKGNMQ